MPSARFVSTSAVRAFQDLKYIRAVDSRIAGTAGDKRAIDYMAKNFRKSGLEVKYDDSGLDTCPKLDENLKPVCDGSEVIMISGGSKSVREAIEKHQPALGLHGHIHESRGFIKIGRALCLNPGSEYSEGMLRGVVVDLDEKGVKNYLLTVG